METMWSADFSSLTNGLGSLIYTHLEYPTSKIHIAVSQALPSFYERPWNSPYCIIIRPKCLLCDKNTCWLVGQGMPTCPTMWLTGRYAFWASLSYISSSWMEKSECVGPKGFQKILCHPAHVIDHVISLSFALSLKWLHTFLAPHYPQPVK